VIAGAAVAAAAIWAATAIEALLDAPRPGTASTAAAE
jgi:hypothetical protein